MEDNKEFILYLYQVCEMGVTSTKHLLDIINNKDNKIKKLLTEELNEYEEYFAEVKNLIDKKEINPKPSSMMSKIGSTIGMNFEMMNDNSDARIADMLIQGYTMGVLEITKKMKQYKDSISKEEKNLAERINKTQNKNIKELKKYL